MEKEVRLQLRSDEMISFLKKKFIHSSSIDVIVSTRIWRRGKSTHGCVLEVLEREVCKLRDTVLKHHRRFVLCKLRDTVLKHQGKADLRFLETTRYCIKHQGKGDLRFM